MQFCVRKRTGIWAGLIVVSSLLMGQPALATPLNLDLLPGGPTADPDIFAGAGTVTYTAASDSLVITLNAQKIFTAGINYTITPSGTDFTLNAIIDDSGVMSSGSFTIFGSVPDLDGFDGDLLLSGTLTNFGFGGAGSLLEWEFLVTGGDAASLYTQTGGIILSGSQFPGAWTGDFGTGFSFTGLADVGIVPEPSTALLLGLGLMGLALRGRRQA